MRCASHGCRQVFGLMDMKPLASPTIRRFPDLDPVLVASSFPYTAAGQRRIHTGFPINPGARPGTDKHKISTINDIVNTASSVLLRLAEFTPIASTDGNTFPPLEKSGAHPCAGHETTKAKTQSLVARAGSNQCESYLVISPALAVHDRKPLAATLISSIPKPSISFACSICRKALRYHVHT